MKINMHTAVGPFEGVATAEQLVAALALLPGAATVRVEQWDSQRDGAGFRVHASWVEER